MDTHFQHRLIVVLVLIQFLGGSLYSQRRRPPSTPSRTRSTAESQTDVNQIEQKNQALLQQIMNLQKERDFYKRKITSWTQSQMDAAQDKKEPETEQEEEEQKQPAFSSGAMAAYYLPITSDILDTLLNYRDRYRQTRMQKHTPMDDDSLLQYAQRLAVMGHYNEARESYERLIRSRKVKDIYYLEYGEFLYKTGDFQRALEILTGVTGGNRELAVASYYKGRIYQMSNANTVAEIDFYRSRYLDPEFPGADAIKAFDLMKRGELDSAKILLTKMVQQRSEIDGELFYHLAKVYDALNRHKEAVRHYQKSIVHDPLYIKSYVELAKALYETGDYQSCILFCQQVLDVYDDRLTLISHIARSRYFLKQWDEALEEFQQLEKSPKAEAIQTEWIPKIYYIQCLLAREKGDHKEALDLFRKAREINPEAYDWMMAALDDLGRIYAQDSDYNDALSYYSRLIRLNPDDVETLIKIGKFYYYLGDINEARRYFTQALSDEKNSQQAKFWLQQINSIR